MIINLNGRIVSPHQAKVSVLDHGFLYGVSIYETLRTYGGKLFLLDLHLSRLRESARGIQLRFPFSTKRMKQEIERALEAAQYAESYLRVIVTAGGGELSYDRSLRSAPNLIIMVLPLVPPPPNIYSKGVTISLVSVRRNLPAALNPAIKSGNLLNPMLAWNEGHEKGAYEALMLNYRGELTECTMSNLFLVKNRIVKTPAPECGILPGLTRNLVLETARHLWMEVQETSLFPADLYEADEALLTVTSREIIPVVRCDKHVIGTGLPGPITRKLHKNYQQKVRQLMKDTL